MIINIYACLFIYQVPVIKFQDKLTNLKVDITMNSDNGVEACRLIKKMIKKYPGLRELTMIIKHYLSLLDLNEVFSGGLGGYATVCLVLSFLQVKITMIIELSSSSLINNNNIFYRDILE